MNLPETKEGVIHALSLILRQIEHIDEAPESPTVLNENDGTLTIHFSNLTDEDIAKLSDMASKMSYDNYKKKCNDIRYTKKQLEEKLQRLLDEKS